MLTTNIITIRGNRYSEKCMQRCLESLEKTGSDVGNLTIKKAFVPEDMSYEGFKKYPYTYPMYGESKFIKHKEYPTLKLEGYRTVDYKKVWAAAMSHLFIWKDCYADQSPYLVLEHDTVFTSCFQSGRFLNRIKDGDVVMINDPRGCTRRGTLYYQNIMEKGPGVHPIDGVNQSNEKNPDGLAGGSAYVITPKAAKHAIDLVNELGIWPNDALLCKQFFTGDYALKASFPFYTKPIQIQSTTTG